MYKKGFEGWRKHLDFMIIDLLCMHVSMIVAYMFRHGWELPYVREGYIELAILLTMIDWGVSFFFNTFKNVIKRGYYKEFLATIKHVFLTIALLTFYLFSVQKGDIYSRIFLYLFIMIYLIVSYGGRLLWKRYLFLHGFRKEPRSLLVITEQNLVYEVLEALKQHKGEQFRINGIILCDEVRSKESIDGIPVVADLHGAVEYVCRQWVDEVFIHTTSKQELSDKLTIQFLQMGVTVHQGLTKQKSEHGYKQFLEKLGTYTVLTSSINTATPVQLFFKRLLDIIGGFVGCFCTMIIFIVIAPMIKKESPGPVFFSQVRIGKNGRKFKIYKFRSMYLDAEERKAELLKENRIKDGFMFKLEYDPRIIGSKRLPDGTIKRGIGNMIRDYSLDEFPQFFNVLRGEMSLVGTRPPTIDEWEKYEFHHRVRLATKPGITGMWQVNGRSNITDFEEVVKLDTMYITEWSLGLDLKILLKTIISVVKRDGSM